jgi:hypothetical protein
VSNVRTSDVQVDSVHSDSPFNVLCCYLVPAVPADGQDSVFVSYVYFDVRVVAFAVPWVLAGVSHVGSTCLCCGVRALFADLSSLSQQHSVELGEFGESENALFILSSSPSVIGTLAPAIETSFHRATPALSIIEWSRSRSPARSLSQNSGSSRQETAQRTNKLLARNLGRCSELFN